MMQQSRLGSLRESITSTCAGFVFSLACQWAFFVWWLEMPLRFDQNLLFAVIMTAVSVGRGYLVRRAFEYFRLSLPPLSPFMLAVIAERRRQIDQECWSLAHDDAHKPGELAAAGAAYLFAGSRTSNVGRDRLPRWWDKHGSEEQTVLMVLWPWGWDWWKPRVDDRRRDLVRGCALGIAEGEKFDRARGQR